MSTPTKAYQLKIDDTILSCTISLQEYSKDSFIVKKGGVNTNVTSVTVDTANPSIDFSVTGGDYINAIVTAEYNTKTANNVKSLCNICFILAPDSTFIWQVTGTYNQGENPTIFDNGKGSNTTEHITNVVNVHAPTEANNPNVPPSVAKVLNPTQVYVVDYIADKNNLLIRGNSPLGQQQASGSQLINFGDLENAIQKACTAASITPSFDSYELYDISLLSSAEEYIWANEFFSFGNTGTPSSETQQWIPSAPGALKGVNDANKTGTWSRWNVEPDMIGTTLADLVTKLSGWMNASNSKLHIYYVHCASGHDRTGMLSASYLANKNLNADASTPGQTVDDAFIMGTSLQKQTAGGGDIVASCYKWDMATNTGTADVSSIKSRCFLAGGSSGTYNGTFKKAMAILQPSYAPYTLGDETTQKETGVAKPYVIDKYPFPKDA